MHYQIIDKLGVGGMGEVYKATDTRLGRTVALKFLPEMYQHDPDRRARFFTEAQAAARLNSPFIAALYDIAEADGKLFLVIEFVSGESLENFLDREILELNSALELIDQLLSALGEAHGKGIVHRDIKPANIMVEPSGRIKVLDFGLAKISDAADLDQDRLPTVVVPNQTLPGTVMGTVSYMSPEQALGRPIDHRSDLFSAGILLFELLTGRLPFDGESATEKLTNIVHADPPNLDQFLGNAPLGLGAVVGNALTKDANARYQTAEQFQTDLRLVLSGNGVRVESHRSGLKSSLRTNVTPKKQVDSGFDTLIDPSTVTHVPNAIAVLTFQNVTRNPEDDWIGAGIAETVSADFKNIKGVVVIGRERVFDALRAVTEGLSRDSDDEHMFRIGRHVGARWLVAGGFQKIGDTIRITARSLDVTTGTVARSVKLDGKVGDIFDLQDRIVLALTEGLNLSIGTSELNEIEKAETVSIEAYEQYAKGITCLRNADRKSIDRAIEYFQVALQHDGSYSLAWAALGAAHNLKGSFLAERHLIQQAVEYLLKAIALSPTLGFAHEQLGATFVNLGQWDQAIAALETALNVNPGQASTRSVLGRCYWLGLGKLREGARELEAAIAIDPNLGYSFLQLGLIYSILGDYDRAEEVCLKAIEFQEQASSGTVGLRMVGAHTRLGYVFYLKKQFERALSEYDVERRFLRQTDHALQERTLIELDVKEGAAWLRVGERDRGLGALERASSSHARLLARGSDDPFTRYYVACGAALAGNVDLAFGHLQSTATRLPALTAVRIQTDPDLESLREDPRFVALTRI